MIVKNSKSLASRTSMCAILTAAICIGRTEANAASFTPSVFATGAAVSATAPDSVTYGGGSVWIEYGNHANSSDYAGKSTIAQYSTAGAIQNTYSLAGSVDGLKYNPNTGQIWALQNQDGNSQLSIINPATKAISTFYYGHAYMSVAGSRGFDDVAFIGNNVYLSETNPASTADAVVVKLNSATPSTPINFTSIQTGAGVLATDPDSLKSTPTGGLVLTGEHDGALTFISNPGLPTQTAASLKLSGAGGAKIGSPDDSIYATSTSGTFYVTDTAANTVYAINASGLTANSSLFVNVGTEFGALDPSTGVVTEILAGSGLHGAAFVPTPEPASFGIAIAGLAIIGFGLLTNASRSSNQKNVTCMRARHSTGCLAFRSYRLRTRSPTPAPIAPNIVAMTGARRRWPKPESSVFAT